MGKFREREDDEFSDSGVLVISRESDEETTPERPERGGSRLRARKGKIPPQETPSPPNEANQSDHDESENVPVDSAGPRRSLCVTVNEGASRLLLSVLGALWHLLMLPVRALVAVWKGLKFLGQTLASGLAAAWKAFLAGVRAICKFTALCTRSVYDKVCAVARYVGTGVTVGARCVWGFVRSTTSSCCAFCKAAAVGGARGVSVGVCALWTFLSAALSMGCGGSKAVLRGVWTGMSVGVRFVWTSICASVFWTYAGCSAVVVCVSTGACVGVCSVWAGLRAAVSASYAACRSATLYVWKGGSAGALAVRSGAAKCGRRTQTGVAAGSRQFVRVFKSGGAQMCRACSSCFCAVQKGLQTVAHHLFKAKLAILICAMVILVAIPFALRTYWQMESEKRYEAHTEIVLAKPKRGVAEYVTQNAVVSFSDLQSLQRVKQLPIFQKRSVSGAFCLKNTRREGLQDAVRKRLTLRRLPADVAELLADQVAANDGEHEASDAYANSVIDSVDKGKAHYYKAFYSTVYAEKRPSFYPPQDGGMMHREEATEGTWFSCVGVSSIHLMLDEELVGWDEETVTVVKGTRSFPCDCKMLGGGWFGGERRHCGTCEEPKLVEETRRKPVFKRHKVSMTDAETLQQLMQAELNNNLMSVIESKYRPSQLGSPPQQNLPKLGGSGDHLGSFVG
uniref:Uncharacterized protein n=1 Tax=Chromera velia CCMP2878 TaxID=1169474 RepID=A0A0G4HWM6_9ALVE|mmetsp:Transcript_46205/g.91080  ORF Transcript_46205/g.91080 Transcript_46205/m.91080 type:complete len:679 (-) Transcript_46205:235-2271(-)|eukprot:Cvel_9053.t1-p1 / transcript=Cvel_9053.t1 / gene=Cvel_9053 / organism=Chromera_velia_CCMP2878 / gene_product=hypothetical protein / transcript_product=hypothetical protein / location=Cvel_scaffold513:35167-37584(-) / protein_length=678 / sequence_SO=supercontig / SO=protein_coding / is_pseudo=false